MVTVRLWDQQVAAAYRESFAEFTRAHPDIEVHTNRRRLLQLLQHAAHRRRRRQRRRHLLDLQRLPRRVRRQRPADGDRHGGASAWEPSVVDQFTRDGALWGVPQLTDAGIAVYYNADLLAAAGVDPAELDSAALESRRRRHAARRCWPASPSTPTGTSRAHRVSTPDGSASGATTRPTTRRASTSTTSGRPAGCSSTTTTSRSTTQRPWPRSAIWSA